MRLWIRALGLFLFALMMAAAPAQPPAASEADRLAVSAQAAARGGNLAEAWALIRQMDAVDPEAWKRTEAFVKEIIRGINAEAKRDVEGTNPERGVQLINLLAEPEAEAIVKKVFPANVAAFSEAVRLTRGIGYFKIGQKLTLQQQWVHAISNLQAAGRFLKPGDAIYAQALYDLANATRRQADAQLKAGVPDVLKQYISAYEQFQVAMKAAEDFKDTRLVGICKLNLDELSNTVLREYLDSLRTRTPAPSPTPDPTVTGRMAELGKNISDFFTKAMGGGPALMDLLVYIGILIGVVVVYWVIPSWLLNSAYTKGDGSALAWIERVKLLGIFALLGYYWGFLPSASSKPKQSAAGKNACPHCKYNLDDPFSYEDLVFSRCPKCREQITPIYTLEGFVTFLSNSVATDVEKQSLQSNAQLERYLQKDINMRLVRAILTLGVRRRASDLHIEPDETGLLVRQRVDGMITEMFKLPRSLAMPLVSAMKVQANLNIAEKRVPQDGKMQFMIDKAEIDIRVASSPAGGGEKVSLRLLDVRSIQMETRHLGLSPRGQAAFERAVSSPHGLILVAGPTGSGKTTTLYVALQRIKTTNKNIISIEDPIEFRVPGVNQIQVNVQQGLTFATGLRSILRQDPDVIMVGEIRDHETAEISVNSALTGHLVLSTLHTIDAAASVARLIDLGVTPRQFADALSLIMAQRLARLVCQYCAEEYVPTKEQNDSVELTPDLVAKGVFRRGKGCTVCNNTGYYRRTGIFETLELSDRLRGALEHEKLSTAEIRELAIAGGMRTLRQEALELLLKGLVTFEETLRMTK